MAPKPQIRIVAMAAKRQPARKAPAARQRLRHGCRDVHVAWCCPRRRRVGG